MSTLDDDKKVRLGALLSAAQNSKNLALSGSPPVTTVPVKSFRIVNGVRQIIHQAPTVVNNQITSHLHKHVSKVLEEEIRASKINKIKLLNDWKVVMRIAKIDELRKELINYLQNFNRDLNNKDAILQMLDADIEEAEEHYSIALNNHYIHLQQLTNLQDNRIKGLFKEFDRDVTTLEEEFKKEFSQLKANYEDEQAEINKMLLFINNEKNLKEGEQREKFRLMKEHLTTTIKEKNQKIQEKIQKSADGEVNGFSNALNDIKAKAKEKNQLDKTYIEELNRLDKSIAGLKKKVDKYTETSKHMKTKIKQNVEDWEQKNRSLKDEKEKIMESYKKLKDKMIAFRNDQRDKLKKLVKNSFECNLKLTDYIDLSEKILRLAEICRRLETEREKILPYYKDSDIVQSDIALSPLEKILGIDSKMYDEIEALSNFWKRYNKVLLDSIAIKKQKEEIEKQNELLKNLLQQYYDGLTVNNVVMNSKENPLLIIDNQANLYNILEDKFANFTLQERNKIVGEVRKQKYFSAI